MLINVAVFIIEILILHNYIIASFALWNCDKDVKVQLFEKLKNKFCQGGSEPPSTFKTVPILVK